MSQFIERYLHKLIIEDFKDIEAVFINGARQTGKSTFVSDFAKHFKNVFEFSFDDITMRSNEINMPGSSFENIDEGLVILDEIQFVPNSFLPLKAKIDSIRRKKQNVRFLLTGSADIMLFPQLAQSLVGRMYIRTMYPFSASEISGSIKNSIKNMFDHCPKNLQTFSDIPAQDMICKATFPKLSLEIKDKQQWCQSYINSLMTKDIQSLVDIDKVEALPSLLNILANRVGGILNDTAVANASKLSLMTIRRYRSLLSGFFLISTLPPWSKNIEKRFIKAPKIYFNDTFLLCHILGLEPAAIAQKRPDLYGFVLENFVACEIRKQIAVTNDAKIFHFRTQDQKEIDFIVEKQNGDLLAIEIKASTSVFPGDIKHIQFMQKEFPKNFIRGIVLYQGNKTICLDKDIYAMPMQSIWQY
jgi:predicted AAA+ superfamily ATPase